MDTPHSQGKSSGNPTPAKASATTAYWIRLQAKENSRPFAAALEAKSAALRKPAGGRQPALTGRTGGFEANDRGQAIMACWRELGRLRPGIHPDACALGPHEFRGILMLAPDGAEPPTLSEAVRLFKVMAALRLSQLDKADALPRNRQGTGSRRNEPAPDQKRLPSALWQKGYTERPLTTAQEIAAARKDL